MVAHDFWDDKENAQKIISKTKNLKKQLTPFYKLAESTEDFSVILELYNEEPDPELKDEALNKWPELKKLLDNAELISFLSEKLDKKNAILTIHAGAGGTESCDWANMLFRLYTRWIESHDYTAEIIDSQAGDEAGIKSVTIIVKGEFAYGYLKAEKGVHRLVRISPFDSNKRRHTSFAAIDVIAEIDSDIEIDIDEKDLKIDTFRSSGAGGQHVNTTDSAIRITHSPSGIVVSCQNQRSQHKNKATAMKILKAKLYQREEKKRLEEQNSGPKEENAWGSQIRSYVLHPYQMIKDLRTNVETSNTTAVLDGDIDQFIDAFLRMG